MIWDYKQAERDWYNTEAGKFLKESELNGLRVANAIMRHYVYQFNPWTGDKRTWEMKGTIEELELIASDELSVTGVGDRGKKDLLRVLLKYKEKNNAE